jgi:large subunit ribosomal protein L24
VIAGKDKGHVGEIIEAIPKKGKVVVQGANYKVGSSCRQLKQLRLDLAIGQQALTVAQQGCQQLCPAAVQAARSSLEGDCTLQA